MGVAGVVVVAALVNLVAAEVGDARLGFVQTCARGGDQGNPLLHGIFWLEDPNHNYMSLPLRPSMTY